MSIDDVVPFPPKKFSAKCHDQRIAGGKGISADSTIKYLSSTATTRGANSCLHQVQTIVG
jgi:hypothetical protein